jgi:hypothetical protein
MVPTVHAGREFGDDLRMPVVSIPGSRIVDWATFHTVFAEVLGFPAFYGRNMDAWIDCIADCDQDSGMVSTVVPASDVLTLQIEGVAGFRSRCPEQFDALIDASAFVNWRRVSRGDRAIVALSFAAIG